LNEPADDYQFFGFGLGITTDESGQSWLGGKKIVGWQDDTPMTLDPKTGNLFANIVNMTTGNYMPGIQMPTTIAARGGGRGPIATAPTGSGRVFWADDEKFHLKTTTLIGGLIMAAIGFGVGGLYAKSSAPIWIGFGIGSLIGIGVGALGGYEQNIKV
jgi:hypothetical protein